MAIVPYLAMTAAEFDPIAPPGCPIGWMACHFSPYGTGLSNLPEALPKGSLLILNDRTPVFGHSPERIARQLATVAEQFQCSGILLDFQRPEEAQIPAIAAAVTALSFPVAVTPAYAEGLTCGVFLPPAPMTVPMAEYVAPWKGRTVWLEVATQHQCIRVSETGSQEIPWDGDTLPCPHTDDILHCQYRMEVAAGHIDFFLRREAQHLGPLMEEASSLGVRQFVGLYQQLGSSFAQQTAADTARCQP